MTRIRTGPPTSTSINPHCVYAGGGADGGLGYGSEMDGEEASCTSVSLKGGMTEEH